MLGKPVVIDNMQTSWYWFQPVIKLDNVDITTSANKSVAVKKLLVGIDLFKSLLSWQIQPGLLYIEDVKLVVRQKGQNFELDGIDNKSSLSMSNGSYLPLLKWLLSQQKIIIKNVSVNLYLENGELLPLEQLNFAVSNQFGHYQLRGTGKLIQSIPTEINLIGDLTAFGDEKNIDGGIYLELHNFYPAKWQNLLAGKSFKINNGQGSAKFWFTIKQSNLKSVQSNIDFKDISLSKNKITNKIQSFTANLLWNNNDNGWELTADNINLKFNNTQWLNNKLKLVHNQEQETYQLFISKFNLGTLNTINVKWPEEYKQYLSLQPSGELKNLKIGFKNLKLNYFLTNFSDLSWHSNSQFPGVKNLTGVLYWEPDQGRLELDSKNTVINLVNNKPIVFKKINSGFEWKLLSQGYRINVDRFILERPDAVINLEGTVDALNESKNPLLNLKGQYSIDNPKKWFSYLPKKHIKPGLYDWLTNNLLNIGKVAGQWKLQGNLKDYPFDNNQGQFQLTSYLKGIDLIYRKGWPAAKNMDAYMRVSKRDMDIDILHADITDLTSHQMNVKIYDIGNNHEEVLVHGKILSDASNFQQFISQSPLNDKLAFLNDYKILGALNLDLHIQAPLDKEEIFTLGQIDFKNNEIRDEKSQIDFKNIHGILKFDEAGVLNGKLNTNLWAEPLDVHFLSNRTDIDNSLEIIFKGNTSLELLKTKFALDLPFVNGTLNLLGTVKIYDGKNKPNHLNLKTSLEQVTIDAPEPLGKSRGMISPLNIDIDFKNTINSLRFNYDSRVKGDIDLQSKNIKGIIQFGNNDLSRKISSNKIQITGFLKELDFDTWYKFVNSFKSEDTSSNLSELFEFNNLKLGSVNIYNNTFKDVLLNAEYTQKALILNIAHETFEANLNYNMAGNNLTGHINHLEISSNMFNQDGNGNLKLNITPQNIPDLNFTIDELKVDEYELGKVHLLIESKDNNLHIKSLNIKSNIYDLAVSGDWNTQTNLTALNGKFRVMNVSKLLTQFQLTEITDAFEAQTMESNINVNWNGAIYDFAVNKLNGSLHTVVRNGRISNFSPETEEKLGFAKLLSILSLQTIPRRLKLDFSDWSKDGYSFDIYKGNFVLDKGIMRTKDSYIDGPVAYASIKGDIDLTDRSFDLNLHVAPHITASLPVVATIAGGPVAGIATWVVSKIVNQSMEKISGYTYKISGPWSQPVVQQVNIIKSSNKQQAKQTN